VVAAGLAARASVPPTAFERVRSNTAPRELRAEVDLLQAAVLKVDLLQAAVLKGIAVTTAAEVEMIGTRAERTVKITGKRGTRTPAEANAGNAWRAAMIPTAVGWPLALS